MKLVVLGAFTLMLLAVTAPTAQAASKSFDITATSSSFSPSSLSVNKGDEVTLNFSVPSDDSYCCGLEIRSSAFSTVTVAKGGSNSVSLTASSSFTFSSYWPSTQVHKADGTVVASSPTPAKPTISKPTITKVSPSTFKQRTSGTFAITITGANFQKDASVKVGKIKASKVSLLSENKLKAIVPRKNIIAGKHSITVTNKDGGKVTKKRAITIVL